MEYKSKPMSALLRSTQTVFSFHDVALLWRNTDPVSVQDGIQYYLRTGALRKVHRGFYSPHAQYDARELATKIYTPSYLSLETVLAQEGVIFQYYDQLFLVSYLSRELVVDVQAIRYRKIKESMLYEPAGIRREAHYSIATPERAILDVLYLNNTYHFDNLRQVDWVNLKALAPLYGKRSLVDRIAELESSYQESM